MWSFWLSSMSSLLYWNSLVGWLRLSKLYCSLRVFLPNPDVFPFLFQVRGQHHGEKSSITTFALSLFFPPTGITISNSYISIIFLIPVSQRLVTVTWELLLTFLKWRTCSIFLLLVERAGRKDADV